MADDFDWSTLSAPEAKPEGEWDGLLPTPEEDRAQKVRETQTIAKDIDPARQAKALEVAKQKGVPAEVAYENLEELSKQEYDWDALVKGAPTTAELMADKAKGPIAKGDQDVLGGLEKTVKGFGEKVVLEDGKPFDGSLLGPSIGVLSQEESRAAQRDRIAEFKAAKQAALQTVEQAKQMGPSPEDILQRLPGGRALEGFDLTPQEQFLYRTASPPEDGTPRQITVEVDGKAYNIPSQWDGRQITEKEAMRRAAEVGWESWPAYETRAEAEARLQELTPILEIYDRAVTAARQMTPAATAGQDLARVQGDLDLAIRVSPKMEAWRNVTETVISSALGIGAGALEGYGRLWDALFYFLPQTNLFDATDQKDGVITQLGKDLGEKVQELFPADPGRARDLLGTQLPAGAASTATFLGVGALARAVGASAGWASGILGSLAGAGQSGADAEKFKTPEAQQHLATIIGALFGATEAVPVERFFQLAEAAGGRSFVQFLSTVFKNAGTEMLQEGVQTGGPDIFAKLTYDPDRDIARNLGDALAVAGLTGGGFGILAGLGQMRTPENKQKLLDIRDMVARSNTGKVAPEILAEHLRKAAEAGNVPTTVTAPVQAVETLLQEVPPADLDKVFPGLSEAVQEARTTGSEVSIQVEHLARMSQLKGYEGFVEDVRVQPDDFTPNEQKAAQKEIEKFFDEYDAEAEVKAPEESPIYKNVYDQLIKAGQAPEVARPQAILYNAFFTTQAERSGKDPNELMKRYGFEVVSQESSTVPTGAMEQARKPDMIPEPDEAYGEPAVRIGDRVFKASDYFPNWERGTRENGAMSPEEDAAIADWGHKELLDRARQALGTQAVDAALEANPEAVMGNVDAAGQFKGMRLAGPKTMNQRGGIKVYRGSTVQETADGAGDFTGTFVSTDRASAAQYGDVTEYTLPPETKILDMNDQDPSGTAAGVMRAYLIGKGEEAPQTADELDEAAAELHMLDNYEDWPAFVQSLGFQATKFGPDIRVFDRGLLQSTQPKITDTPAFKAWFGDSKVVDENGAPLVVYHHGSFDENTDTPAGAMHFGTEQAATERSAGKRTDDALKAVSAYQSDDGSWHWDDGAGVTSEDMGNPGFPSKDRAEAFGRTFVLETLNDDGAEDGGQITATYLNIKNPKRVRDQGDNWDEAIAQAKAEGYDGIVYRNEYEDKGSTSYIAFDPTQIKSVNNRGTFDQTNPNILSQDTTTPAFRAWFGNSKVVDENGSPLVVYHGTDKDISAFDPAKRGSSTGVESARQAFWFSASPDNAGEFASLAARRQDGNPNIMPVYLSLQNPLEVDASVDLSFSETITRAKAAGHDGVIFRNAQDTTRNPSLKIGDEIYSIDHRGMFMSESLPEFLAGKTTVEAIQNELDEAASYFAEEAKTDPDMVDEAREWAEIRNAWAKDPSQFSIDYGPSADVFAVFEPTSIKSAIGNVGTFDPRNPNILQQGIGPGSPQFQNWFEGSKVADRNGVPKVMYHGTRTAPSKFKDMEGLGLFGHFGVVEAANDKVEFDKGEGKRGLPSIMPVYLAIKNPVRMSDIHFDSEYGLWAEDLVKRRILKKSELPRPWEDRWNTRAGKQDVRAVVELLKAKGYDGIVYENRIESPGEDSWIPFAPTQIKSAVGNNGNFSPNNPSILMQEVGTPVPEEAVNIASLDNANTVSQSRAWDTGRELKQALQNIVLNAVNGADLLARTPENRAYLIRVGVKDALSALAQNANAIGWYDLKTRQALAVMSLVHPELATDETARFAFTWALAVTSNGLKVGKNFEIAESVYARWKASHKDPTKRIMPTDVKGGNAQKAINKSLQAFNDLSRDWGLTPLRLFMLSNFKAGDIKAMSGITPTGEWADTDVRGASIIGPKIGNGFFSNLYGRFDALTMDRWLVRTWGRWTGTLIQLDEPNIQNSRVVLREAMKGVDKAALIAALRAVTKEKTNKKTGVTTVSEVKPKDRETLIAAIRAMEFGRGKGVLEAASDDRLDDLADAILHASQEPKFREAMNSVQGGEALRKAGNNLAKYLDGQKEQPEGPGERVYIREIFSEMLKELQADPRYAGLTMSDLQAVLWYAEKRLYETAKEDIVAADVAALEGTEVAGYDDDDAPDYANAAAEVARSKGVSERRIKATLQKEENRGRSEAAQPDAGGTGQQGSVAGSEGQPPAARGFTRSERKEFIQRRALDRVRADRGSDAESSGAYARASGKARGGPRVLKDIGAALGAAVRDVWAPGTDLKRIFNRAEINTPNVYEVEPGAESAARFSSYIADAKKALGAIGEAVYIYPVEDYANMRLFLAEGGKAGFALKPDGDIVSVFSSPGTGAGRAIMETAIAAGGKKLDCFHTILPEFYSAHGFRGVSRLLWNDEVAKENMPNWDKVALAEFNGGEPDVVFMVYDPSYRGTYDRQATPLFNKDPATDYDRAAKAQAKAAKAVASGTTTLLQAVTDTPEFRNWFGDSKVRDESGAPLVVYHGTASDISRFRTSRSGFYGSGIYLTDSPDFASEFANDALGNADPNVMPLFVKMERPYYYHEPAGFNGELAHADLLREILGDKAEPIIRRTANGDSVKFGNQIMRALKDMGHDGLIVYGPHGNEYVAFDPTQIKSATGNSGAFDPNNPSILKQEARGFIQFTPAKDKFKITLTGKANLSTFLHESGHFFLEVLQDQVMRGEASPDQVRDMEAIRAWMGLQPGQPIGVREHEMWARGFEAYLMEGKAPSAALNEPFQKFKAWLLFVYKRLAGLNVNLSDDIRQVMDRLVASDQAISEARVQIGLGGSPMKQDAMGLTDEEYATYVDSWMKARDQQSMDADARVLADAARALSETWKAEYDQEVAKLMADVEKTRGAMARKAIEEGDLKLNKEMVPQELRRMARGLMDDAGLDIDTMAEMLNMGFTSGEQMLQTIAGSDQLRRDVKARARAIMAERHGEMNPATLAVEAMKAVHNKPTGEILLTEYRAMAAKAGIKTQKNTLAMLKAAAEKKVAGMTKRQLDPAKWRRAELKAANESGRLAGQGKAQEAAIAKRQQLMAAAMYKATVDAQERIEKIKGKLTDIQKSKKWAVLGKAGKMYQDGVDQILEAIEFKNVSLKALKKRETLPEIIAAAEAAGEAIAIPDYVLAPGMKNYSQMTLEELEAVHDAVMNLWTLAKLKNTLRDRKEKRDRDEIAAEVEANAERYIGFKPEKDHRNPSFWEKTKAKARSYSAFFSKIEFMVGWLDGQPSGGVLHRFVYQPLADARSREFKMLKEKYQQINAVMDAMPKAQKIRWNTKRQFMGQTMTGRSIIAAVLNMGTESNYTKLLEGHRWNKVQFEAEVNAFMTREDWDAVTNIWTVTGSLWPEFEDVVRRATGIVPPKLEGRVINTPFGEIQGEYYPVVYDPVLDAKQADNQAKRQGERFFDDGVSMAKVIASASNKRTAYTGPIKLDLDVLTAHIAEQVHYITHYDAVTQAWKLISHPKVRAAITKSLGAEFYAEFKPYLQSIAKNAKRADTTDILSEGVDHLRVGTTILTMGYNLVTALKQPLGALTVLDAIGPKYWAIGLKDAWFSPNLVENWRFAWNNSQELEPLMKDFDVALRDLGDVLDLKMDKGAVDRFKRWAFTHIGAMQLIVNVAAWRGAYAEALSKQMTHDDAVRYADSVVRKTQSAASLKDTSQAQRKNALSKAITMYGSFMNVLFNRMQDVWRTTRRPRDVPKAMLRLGTLLLVPSLALVAANEGIDWAFGDDDDEDENDSFLGKVAIETASTFVGSFPGINMLVDVKGYGTNFTPIQRSVQDVGRLQTALADWLIEGEVPTLSEVKAGVKVATVITKLPFYGPYRAMEMILGEDLTVDE